MLGALNFPDCIFHRRSQALGRLPQCQCWAGGIVPVSFSSLLKGVRRSAVYHPKPGCQSQADLADRAGKLEKMQPLCHRHCRHSSFKSSQNIPTVSRACALDHNFKTLVKSRSEWSAFNTSTWIQTAKNRTDGQITWWWRMLLEMFLRETLFYISMYFVCLHELDYYWSILNVDIKLRKETQWMSEPLAHPFQAT